MPGWTTNAFAHVRVEEHDPDLAAVPRIDQARGVDHAQAVPRREPGTRLDESGVALGNLHRDPGRDDGSLSRLQPYLLTGREIDPGIALVCLDRQNRVGVKTANGDVDHRDEAPASSSPATRNCAKRGISRRGSLARTRTPSGVSRRSAIGAPNP